MNKRIWLMIAIIGIGLAVWIATSVLPTENFWAWWAMMMGVVAILVGPPAFMVIRK